MLPDAPVVESVVPDGWLDHVTLAWYRVPSYGRDPDDGSLVVDQLTGWYQVTGWTDRFRARPIGWLDNDSTGRVWCLA